MSLMRRGALFAGALFAGLLFGPQYTEAQAQAQEKPGLGKQARHARKILVERIKSLDDLVEQLAEVTRDEPKAKPLLRKAKKSRPESTASTYDNAQAWIDYYQAVILAFQDQQRANELLEQLQRGIDQINAVLAMQEMQRYMQEMMDQEVFAMFMLMASE